MRPANILHLYRVRLRARLVQELFAVLGIAAGVALLFASQVASHEPVELGRAALHAGSSATPACSCSRATRTGFPKSLLAQVRRDPGRARRGAAAGSERERVRPARAASRSSWSAPTRASRSSAARWCATPR